MFLKPAGLAVMATLLNKNLHESGYTLKGIISTLVIWMT